MNECTVDRSASCLPQLRRIGVCGHSAWSAVSIQLHQFFGCYRWKLGIQDIFESNVAARYYSIYKILTVWLLAWKTISITRACVCHCVVPHICIYHYTIFNTICEMMVVNM